MSPDPLAKSTSAARLSIGREYIKNPSMRKCWLLYATEVSTKWTPILCTHVVYIGWGQTARLQRVQQNTADRIQTETEQQQTARLQRVRQNTADRILKFDKRYKAFEIAGYFQKHRELIG